MWYKMSGISGVCMSAAPSKDRFFFRAKAENYPARSVYKLQEIDRRAGLLKPGLRVLDLGAAPGSWSQYAAQKVGPKGRVVAVDLNPPAREIKGVRWLLGDATALETASRLAEEGPFDLVLSDMAPSTTGQKSVDAARSCQLAEAAFDLALKVLKPKGRAVVKVFMGSDFAQLQRRVRSSFNKSRVIKPEASLKQSRETYLLAFEPALPKED